MPIFHSLDLVYWQQIGHCLTRPSQLLSLDSRVSNNLSAPTLRYHGGCFYMISSNTVGAKPFYVTTENPAGEWSDPIWLDHDVIDPSLFFDFDGKVYLTWTSLTGIFQCEIDIQTGQPLSETRWIWLGTGEGSIRGPKIHKLKPNSYYLVVTEGGTDYGYIITCGRSNSVWGPFESAPQPIITHRDRRNLPIQGTGYVDIRQDHNGFWWLVLQAFQPISRSLNYHHLGSSTYLVSMDWFYSWPKSNSDTIYPEMAGGNLSIHEWDTEITYDDFDETDLKLCWNFLGYPNAELWSLSERHGWLRLKGLPVTLDDHETPAFVGRRQQHLSCTVSVCLDFDPDIEEDEAGITAYVNAYHHYEVAVTIENTKRCVIVRKRVGDLMSTESIQEIPEGIVFLRIEAEPEQYGFSYSVDGKQYHLLATSMTRYLSSEVTGEMMGVYFGMYSTIVNSSNSISADFDWFNYETQNKL